MFIVKWYYSSNIVSKYSSLHFFAIMVVVPLTLYMYMFKYLTHCISGLFHVSMVIRMDRQTQCDCVMFLFWFSGAISSVL